VLTNIIILETNYNVEAQVVHSQDIQIF